MPPKKPATPRQESPAFRAYHRNRRRIYLLLDGLKAEVRGFEKEMARIAERAKVRMELVTRKRNMSHVEKLRQQYRLNKDEVRETAKLLRQQKAAWKRIELVGEFVCVMIVTCCETYLQDVLVDCAARDRGLMGEGGQTATYDELLTARSIETLTNELRQSWARNWVDDGGPKRWIARLTVMGAQATTPTP